MADFINTIDVYGDEVVAGKIVDRSITEFNDDVLTSIGTYAFYKCKELTSVSLPNVTSLESHTFYEDTALTSISLPKVTSIGANSFYWCRNLPNISLPNVTSIGDSAFRTCDKLPNISLPKVTSIGKDAFGACSQLISVTLPATPPTLSNVNAFQGINSACVFYIPTGSRSAYESATNWSTLTGQYTFTEV